MKNMLLSRAARLPALALLIGASVLADGEVGAQCPPRAGEIALNGRIVRGIEGRSLLELVRTHPRARRFEAGSYRDDAPVVVLNGVLTSGGLPDLTLIAVHDVDSVTVLGPSEAVARYGSVAYRGAVAVSTRKGFTHREAATRALLCEKGES